MIKLKQKDDLRTLKLLTNNGLAAHRLQRFMCFEIQDPKQQHKRSISMQDITNQYVLAIQTHLKGTCKREAPGTYFRARGRKEADRGADRLADGRPRG